MLEKSKKDMIAKGGGTRSYNLKSIKLVIWDLDETFWHGTLSDNDCIVKPDKNNIKLVKLLTDKGIINSICSKNDFEFANKELNKPQYDGVIDCFVFSSINWEPKGKRVKNIIDNMNLRSENVLFIDDNKSNLSEAKFYCPDIKTALPDIVDDLIRQSENIKKSDLEHKRLKRYKILENKLSEKKNFSSNDLFLIQSNIKVEIKDNCKDEFERILELIKRTNQLNYTKIRLKEDELEVLLNNKAFENRYITVSDKYGDYGICGFYSLDKKENKLLHYLFSCRILSMGVEQYIWDLLNYPALEVVGDVAQKLEKNKKCPWINTNNIKNEKHIYKKDQSPACKILVKGTCDMARAVGYLKADFENLEAEISYIDDEEKDTANNQRLIQMVNSHKLSKETKEEILKDADFLPKTTYDTNVFDKKYDVIVYSLLLDTRTKLYLHKNTGEYIGWWQLCDFTDIKNRNYYLRLTNIGVGKCSFSKEALDKLFDRFIYKGYMTPEQVIENLEYVINNVHPDTKWIFILGSKIKPTDEQMKKYGFRYRYERNLVCNKKIINYLKKKKNVKYFSYSDVIKSNKEYTDLLDHFVLEVYKRTAHKIAQNIYALTGYRAKSLRNYKLENFLNKLRKTCILLKCYIR